MTKRLLIVVLLFLITGNCFADNAESLPDRNDWVKKTAKLYRKDGWAVKQGNSMEDQLTAYFNLLYAEDANHHPVYVSGKGIGSGRSYDSAERVAQTKALYDLSANISVEIKGQIERKMANVATSSKDIMSITEVLAVNEQQVASKIIKPTTAMTLYRVMKDKRIEVCVIVLYSWEQVIKDLSTDEI